MTDSIHHTLSILADGKNLPLDIATRAFQIILNGGATPAQIAAFLMGLRIKGETIDEITAGATAMRVKAKPFKSVAGAIDTCGTGGDARGTYNISTTTAFVLAACGLPVVKHGNRSVSSLSGSADVLAVLGVKTDCEPEVAERCLHECGIAFLLAPKFHPAMRHVTPIRQELGLRTIFNILGPLTNPAAPDFQLLGVYNKSLLKPLAESLKSLGTKAAWVVHGSDGLDELTITGSSSVVALKDGEISEFEVSPEDAGLPTASLEDIKGGDPQQNASAMIEAISGVESPYRNAVVYNAAAGMLIAGKASDLKEGAELAKQAIDSGKAHSILKKLVDISNTKI
ncbi:MAG: anthranilate phosphoribosyltransferase [Rickettsiales bacterium]